MSEGLKDDGGKVCMDLLSPSALVGTARVLTHGAVKYGDNNWMLGLDYSRVYAALQRHLNAFWDPEESDLDGEWGIHHLHHAACCLMFLQHYEEHRQNYANFDDRFQYENSTDPADS